MCALISIILPTYNGEIYLEKALDSIYNQTYSNWECIIVDDASTDTTPNIIEKNIKKDHRFETIRNVQNKKLPASLNIGHKESKGEWITWTSDDNLLKPHFLETFIKAIHKDDTPRVLFTNYDIIGEKGQLRRSHMAGPVEGILFGNTIGASFCYHHTVFQELGGYDESLHSVEDYDFWLRAAQKFPFQQLQENCYAYRLQQYSLTTEIHQGSLTEKHKEGVVNALKKVSQENAWSKETIRALNMIREEEHFDLNFWIEGKKHITAEFKRTVHHKNSDPLRWKRVVALRIREMLKKKQTKIGFKNTLWLLKNQKEVFFGKGLSKRETIKLWIKAVKF